MEPANLMDLINLECPNCRHRFRKTVDARDAGIQRPIICPKCEKYFLFTYYVRFQVSVETEKNSAGGSYSMDVDQ